MTVRPSHWRLRRVAIRFAGVGGLVLALVFGLTLADRAYPPPLDAGREMSREVVDRNGRLLRAYTTSQGLWRLPAALKQIDADYIAMLIAYEDRRFYTHFGVDPLALLRAAGQFLRNGGRIVSGGSTITMQVARLIEPRSERSIKAKLLQMARALQIERRLTKDEILSLYLTLAPYGGNVEGVRAASLAWFGREPRKLSLSQSALLVALPQAPEARRPDRHFHAARRARDRVLARMRTAGLIPASEIARASGQPTPSARRAIPSLAAHSADRAIAANPALRKHVLTLNAVTQARLEDLATQAARRLGQRQSLAMILADGHNGDVLASIGSSSYFDAHRFGSIDMSRAVRSPGSALKPFIYGLALEDARVDPATLIDDAPADFAGYRPRNFDRGYMGEVSIRQALQHSLNVPAVRLLEAVGPQRLLARLRRGGASLDLPSGGAPGLAIGLGGAGTSLRDLVQLYTAFVNQGRAVPLRDGIEPVAPDPFDHPVLGARAAWQVADILTGVDAPRSSPRLPIAYKTGTSYGYRDAWAIGFDGRNVLGVWVGRADAAPAPGISGIATAAPLLFEAFAKTGLTPVAPPAPPAGLVQRSNSLLPFGLRKFRPPEEPAATQGIAAPAPRIVYPPQGARVALGQRSSGKLSPLVLKLQGGAAPYRLIANGKPLPRPSRRKVLNWTPDGKGASTLTVMDAKGQAASVSVFIE